MPTSPRLRALLVLVALGCSSEQSVGSSQVPAAASGIRPAGAETPLAGGVDVSVSGEERALAQAGRFVALTYNVAGLPELISRSRPSVHMPLIGERLNRYDLALLQESWQTPASHPFGPLRCYHELLVEKSRHRYKSPSAPLPFGTDRRRRTAMLADGLNVFSRMPLAATERVPWERCVNTFNDCYALKGFMMTPLQLAPGVELHVYNLHMEAGWTPEDDDARDAAIEQLLAYISARSRGRAVIVGGDFNLRGEREKPAAQLRRLLDGAGLRDACVACSRPRNVDKLLYRGSERVKLKADSWRLETDVFSRDGTPLSDHAPLAVRFRWSLVATPD